MVFAALQSSACRKLRKARFCGLLWCLAAGVQLHAASILIGQPVSSPGDLSKFVPAESAKTIRIDELWRADTGKMGFVGITAATNATGQSVVTGVAPESPAHKAGVKTDDVVLSLNGEMVESPDALRSLIESNLPGENITLALQRNAARMEVTAKLMPLGSVGRPMERIRLGVVTGEPLLRGGVRVNELDDDSTGASAGLKVGDVILRVNGTRITETNRLGDLLGDIASDNNATLTIIRAGDELPLQVRLAPVDGPDRPASSFAYRAGYGPRGYNARARRDVLRIAIIGIEFPDVRHNPNIGPQDWEQAFFSTKTYIRESATGQTVHGSLNDYYQEQSAGTMRVGGRMLGWLTMSQNRDKYSAAANRATAIRSNQRFGSDGPLMTEALQKLVMRESGAVFSNFDGFFFIYAGDVATRNDDDVFWPHTSLTFFQNRAIRYSVSFEGGDRMTDISVLCHETGHILGLPDLYVRPPQIPALATLGTPNATTGSRSTPPRVRNVNPYVETLANWDLMAIQAGYGKPEHMSAWSKEQLGWIKPAVIDPRVPQQLILSPIENSGNQCVKIPLRPDGSEYLLLENRRHIGFDESLPGEGLLIWRVVYGRPVLEEAHGYSGANAASISQTRIPYPTERNNSFTPFSTPSSAAYTGDELPVYINNIRRLPDGRIALSIGNGYM